ncbi:MAG: hypothetical protein J6Y94_03390 [Bacteriovoracaceae bacterium]|nr:hypothetical protein [Bacteriovoracaceae bacterium]
MARLGVIYILSFILLSYIYQQGPTYSLPKKAYPKFATLQKLEQRMQQNFTHPEDAALLSSYVRGSGRDLSPRQKINHRALNLQHLWSPSGIHLAAALLWVTACLPRPEVHPHPPEVSPENAPTNSSPNFPKNQNKNLTAVGPPPSKRNYLRLGRNLVLLLCYLLPWALPGYYAIKRICLLKILHLLIRGTPWRPDYFYFFLVVMALDFGWGTYASSPLSFAYSFLFLGILVATKDTSPLQQSAALLGGQVLANYFSYQAMTLLGHFFGQIITSIFTCCFPLFFISYWGQLFFSWPWAQWPIHWFNRLIDWSAAIAISGGYFYASGNILAFMAAIFLPRSTVKHALLIILLILHSDPCFNQSRSKMLQNTYPVRTTACY